MASPQQSKDPPAGRRTPFQPPLSAHSTVIWPALPQPEAAMKLALLNQLEQSHWWSPEQIFKQQLRQAGALLLQAYRHVRLRFHFGP